MAKKKDLTNNSEKDLQKALKTERLALSDFYFEVAGGRATNVKKARNIRKNIARILTAWRKKELAAKKLEQK